MRVSVVDGAGRAVPARGLARWLARIAPASARGEVSIALVSDARIRALNRTYRRMDYPTDVLSFPAERHVARRASHVAQRTWHVALSTSDVHLGDIVIARGVAARQARQEGHSLAAELRVLALHGLLHLLGYDHERDRGEMRRLERRLRRKGGLREGLTERASAPHRHR